jgi:RNA polymerase sigma-70 factor (ECF subfamily)
MALGEGVVATAAAAPSTAAPPAAVDTRLRSLVVGEVDFIWRSLRRLGVAEADLADAAQRVFLVVARKLDRLRAGSERSFLFQTALRVASDVRRTRKRRREVSNDALTEIEDHAPGPDERAESLRRRAQLDEILDALPIELRAVFVLSEIEDLTMAQIALLTDTPPGTVASRLRRARALFRDQVEQLHARERNE